MPRSVVKCLFPAIVCLTIISESESLASSGHPSQSSILDSMRRGFSGFVSSLSRRGNGEGNGGASTSRGPPRSRSPSPERPLPRIPHKIIARNQNDVDVIATFAQMHQNQGDPQMTLAEFTQKKNSMIEMASNDTCRTDVKNGGIGCVNALKVLQTIPREWRGPCGDAFSAECCKWPAPTRTICSFFMKTSAENTAPLEGYVHTMRDCANALSPEKYEKHLNDFADSLLAK